MLYIFKGVGGYVFNPYGLTAALALCELISFLRQPLRPHPPTRTKKRLWKLWDSELMSPQSLCLCVG